MFAVNEENTRIIQRLPLFLRSITNRYNKFVQVLTPDGPKKFKSTEKWMKDYGKDLLTRPLAAHPNVPRKINGSVDVVALLTQQAWMREHYCSWHKRNENILDWLDKQV